MLIDQVVTKLIDQIVCKITVPRTNNFFRSTGPPNLAEELHHQEDQQNCVAQDNEYQEEQPQNLVDETAEIDDTENFQIDPIVSEET